MSLGTMSRIYFASVVAIGFLAIMACVIVVLHSQSVTRPIKPQPQTAPATVEIGNMTQMVSVTDLPDTSRTLTTEEVARLCSVNADTIRRREAEGTLRDFVKVGRNAWQARNMHETGTN